MQGIAIALFGPDQQSFAVQVFAAPQRNGQMAGTFRALRPVPAPLVFFPARLPGGVFHEQRHAKIPVGQSQSWGIAQSEAVAGDGLGMQVILIADIADGREGLFGLFDPHRGARRECGWRLQEVFQTPSSASASRQASLRKRCRTSKIYT